VLILDEPTNHLDIASSEALERALASFEGTILCVSHDRYFLDRTVKRLLVLDPPGVIDFPDSYSAWVQKLTADREDRGRASAEAAKTRAREAKESARGGSREAPRPASRQAEQKPAKAKKDNPYARPFGRLSMNELEQQITDTEVAIAECQETFGDAGALKDPSRAQRLQSEYKELARKLEALEAEYFARGETK
jgi:ATP-binding cassette subfamily F protein 3